MERDRGCDCSLGRDSETLERDRHPDTRHAGAARGEWNRGHDGHRRQPDEGCRKGVRDSQSVEDQCGPGQPGERGGPRPGEKRGSDRGRHGAEDAEPLEATETATATDGDRHGCDPGCSQGPRQGPAGKETGNSGPCARERVDSAARGGDGEAGAAAHPAPIVDRQSVRKQADPHRIPEPGGEHGVCE